MTTAQPVLEAAALIADTEEEILRLVGDHDDVDRGRLRDDPLPPRPRRHGRAGRQADAAAPRPPRLRLDRRRLQAGPARAPRRSSSATTSASSTTTSRTATASGATGRRSGRSTASPRRSTPATCCSACRRMALHRLTDLGFSDAKVLRLMRLYDQTCVALCEGQYIDIATSESRRDDVGRPLLRHDRPQDRRPDRRLDRGRARSSRPTTTR